MGWRSSGVRSKRFRPEVRPCQVVPVQSWPKPMQKWLLGSGQSETGPRDYDTGPCMDIQSAKKKVYAFEERKKLLKL